MSDYDALLNGSWVTDNIVNAGQIIIKVQNILLGMNLQFDIQATEFVQILHIDDNHWRKITRPSKRACSEVNCFANSGSQNMV